MGNRSYLYISTANEHIEIAEANNNIPLLWQYLLVDSEASEAIRDQRVFGDNDTPNLAVPLPEAIDRANQVLNFVAQHPMAISLPHLPRYAQALQAHLAELLATYGNDATLSGNFDEMGWFEEDCDEDDFAEIYPQRLKAEFLSAWQAIEAAITSKDWWQYDQSIAMPALGANSNARLWQDWQFSFGLASFSHPYFGNYNDIHAEDFATFCANYVEPDWDNLADDEHDEAASPSPQDLAASEIETQFALAQQLENDEEQDDNLNAAAQIYESIANNAAATPHLRGLACYRRAWVLNPDLDEASDPHAVFGWMQRASELLKQPSDLGAVYADLGYLHASGLGTLADPYQALRLYQFGSDCGNGVASQNAAHSYLSGQVGDINLAQAQHYFELAIRQNYLDAHAWLGNVLIEQAHVQAYIDQQKALYQLAHYHLRAALATGNAPAWAASLIAQMALDGHIQLPHSEVDTLLVTAAEAGDTSAIEHLSKDSSNPERSSHWQQQLAQIPGATVPTPIAGKILLLIILALLFGGMYWLVRDSGWIRFIPLMLGSYLFGRVLRF